MNNYNDVRIKTKEDWIDILNNEKQENNLVLDTLIYMMNCVDHTSNGKAICKALNLKAIPILDFVHFGKRIVKLKKIKEQDGDRSNNRYANIPFTTVEEKNKNGITTWKIRDELAEALEEKYPDLINDSKIKNLVIGNIYTNNDISEAFKCSNMGGMRRSKTTNSLVLITKHQEKRAGDIYEDEWTSDGILNYTGMGTIGNQDINYAQNKTLATAKQLGINVYLFESYKDNEYYYDGEVEVCGSIFTANEKDIDGKMRQVLKFPLRKIYSDEDTIDQEVIEISNEVNVIFNKVTDNGLLPAFINGELEIRKYNNVEEKRKKIRISKPDYISEEIVKTKNGEINEKKIFEIELEKMLELDAKEEVKKMEDFFNNRKDNEGYDILSFEQDENGNLIEKFIEVKSTKGPESTPIDITDNEINFAKEHINNYYIYRIYNSEKENNSYKILSAKDLFDKYKLIPTTYKIYM